MGMLDEPEVPFTPKPQPKAKDNFQELQNHEVNIQWNPKDEVEESFLDK